MFVLAARYLSFYWQKQANINSTGYESAPLFEHCILVENLHDMHEKP